MGEVGTLDVSWDEADKGTFPIECYLVEFRHPSGEAKKRKQSYPGSRGTGKGCGDEPPTSVKRTDLDSDVQYEVLVQALSGDGFSEWSDMKTARTNQGRALQGRFLSPPERHDGKKRIKVRVEFSEAPENVGADGVEVEGGRVTSVRPVGGNAPGGAGTRSVGGRECRTAGPGGGVGVRDRAGLGRRRDGEPGRGTPVRRAGGDLHRGRAVAVGGHLDDGRGSGRGSAAAHGVVRGRAGGA